MTRSYDVYLTANNTTAGNPDEIGLLDKVDEYTATELALTLNQGGYLRDGVEAHYVASDDMDHVIADARAEEIEAARTDRDRDIDPAR